MAPPTAEQLSTALGQMTALVQSLAPTLSGLQALPGTELMQRQADLMHDFLQSQTEQAGRPRGVSAASSSGRPSGSESAGL